MVKNNLPKQSKGEMLLATASQTVKKENERKSALTAAGVKDIAAYDKAYAPLKDFDKDVTSLYAEINGLLGFDNISDSQLNHAKTNAQELKNRIGQINSFFDTYGNLYDENAVKAMRSDLSNIDSSLTAWLDEASADDYLEKIKTPPTASTSTVATAIKDKESEKARAERGGRDTTQITAELNAMYDNGGAYGQAAKRRNEYNANKAMLEQKKAELLDLMRIDTSGITHVSVADTLNKTPADPEKQKRVQALQNEIANLETKISDYEKAYLASDDAWLAAFGKDGESYFRDGYNKVEEDPVFYLLTKVNSPSASVYREYTKRGAALSDELQNSISTLISDDERLVYNYLLETEGIKAARNWLDSLSVSEARNQRQGALAAENLKETVPDKTLRSGLLSAGNFMANVDNWGRNYASLFAPKATSAMTYAVEEGRKDIGKIGNVFIDVFGSIGNMAPSIAIGAINPIAGKVAFGTSAAANAYNSARKEGKSVSEAIQYGTLVGFSEATLQELLGGIPGISGASNALKNAAKNLAKPALRALAVYGIDIAGEATEEYLQEILDTMFRNAIFNEDNEVKILSGEAAHSAMLGALASAILNIPTLSTKFTKQLGASMIQGGWYDTLLDNALKLDKDSNAFDLANKLKNGELTASEENIGELLRAYKTDDGDLSFLEEKGTVEKMPNSTVTESVDNLKAETNPSELKGEALVLNLLADGEVSNSKAKKILEDPEAMKTIGADVEGLDTISKKRAVIKEAMQNYIAQNAEKIASNAQKKTTAQTATNTATEAQSKDADTFQYKHIVEKQKLGTRLLSELEGRTSKTGEKLADKLTAMATSITGDEDANRAVYKLFANPRYAAAASIEDGAGFLEIIRNFKTDAGRNFARQQMSEFINNAATAATLTELLRKDVNVTLENAAGMKPAEGKSAPKGYYDETDHRVAIADNLLTYETLVGTIAHEGFHANGAIDHELVNNFAKTLEGLWGKDKNGNSVWEATVKRKKAAIEAYTGKPITTLKAEEEVCAETLTKLFNTQKAWDVMGEMFGKIEGSDRLLNRIKNSLDRFFANFKKRFKGEMPTGKLTTFRENLEYLIKETKGVNKKSKTESKKEAKKKTATDAELDAELEAELAEETEVDEEVDEEADEVVDLVSDYVGETKKAPAEEDETVELVSDLYDAEAKGGRLYSAEYTNVAFNEDILGLADKVETGKYKDNETVYLGIVPSDVADEIFDILGIDVHGYKLAVEARQISHIIKDHGKNGKTDRSMADNRDIAKIEYAMNNPDSIVAAGRTQAYSSFINGRNKTAKTVLYEKEIGDNSYYVVQAVPESSAKTLYVVSAFIGEKGYKKEAPQLINAKGPDATSELGSADASNRRIADSNEIVNTSNKNSKKTYSSSDTDVLLPTAEDDAKYLVAVESGDIETAQRMVDEAAKAAGYIGTYYHGTKGDFTTFSNELGGQSNSNAGVGFWFTESEDGARKWADETWYGDSKEGKVYKTYLALRNPKVYETVNTQNEIEELYKGYEAIDREMTLYDSIYYFENGRRYHNERYDFDRAKRRRSNIDEWDAFKSIVSKYDTDTIEYYLSQVSPEIRETVKQDAERYLELSKERKKLEKQISELSYSDAYEAFRTDLYKRAGMSAEDANIGGTGRYIENKDEVVKKYVGDLKNKGYDGILIKDTSYDSTFFGEKNDQYVVFDANQIKSADPITYDDNGNIIPLSERFNSENKDIRYSAEETDVELPTIEERKLERERIKREGKKAGKSTAEINQELHEYDKAQNDLAATAFGTIEPGEKRAREFNAPKQTTKSDKVSLTARTVGEAGVTPEIALPRLESMIANGTFSYEPLKNKDLVAKARAKIGTTQNSFDNALHAWMGNEKLISAEEIATGWLLYDKAIELGRVDTALDIATVISQDARRAGQAVQANRILKSLTPEGQLYVAQRTAKRLTDKLKAEGKTPRVRYTEEDAAVVETARKFGKRRAEDAIAREARKLSRSKEDNVPVEDWAKEIGNDVAEAISKRIEPLNKKDLLVSRAVASDLLKFAENYALPEKQAQGPSRTAAERIADFFANRAQYIEAWNQARDVLREKYKDSPEKLDLLETFLNGTVDYNGEGSDIIMMRAVAEAALNNDVKIQDLMRRAELGDIKGVIDDIYNRLQETVKAEGSDAQLVRDAVQRWVTEKYVQAHPLTQRQIDAVIRKKMVQLGKSVDYIVRSDRKNKGELLQQITAMLVEAFGVSPEAASIAAIKIKERYDGILEKAATSAFERATKERKPAQKKTLDELFMNYANMGAFTSDYDKALTEKLFKRDGIVVDKKLAEDLLNAETEEGRKAALEAIYRDIGSQLPSTFADRERAWRYLAMLGNFRTHGRNIAGNAIFGGVIRTKDLIATAIEARAEKRFGIERTKAVLNPKKDKALLEAARGDAAVIHDMLVYGEKYNDQATNDAIESGRVIFKNKALETLRKKNTEWLEKEDAFFLNRHYAHALAQYCKANGITAKDIQNGNVPDAAREYAIKEAKKATFRDDNDFSKKVSQMRFKGDGVGSKVGNFFVEGILPFRKTPANILVRGVEYSPIGLVKGTYHLFGKVRKGEMSAAEAIDEIASGLTGTGLLLFGYILTALGFIRATGDEEDREMEELMGHQTYALEIGNRSYTLDWLAPAALPFFVGAEIAELKKLEGDVKMADITSAMLGIMGPMLELSCLQSINDLFESVGYAKENEAPAAALATAATSHLTQYIPTIFGQIERIGQSVKMKAYTEKDSFLTSDAQYLISAASAKIPLWDYKQIPDIDAWGRVKDSGNIFSRAAENLIHPFYSSKIEQSAMEMELQRLNDSTGEKSVYPSTKVVKKITVAKEVDGKRVSEDYNLSAEEYVQYAKAKGKTAYDAITAFMGGDVYKMLDDTERVEAIEDIYSYADEYARTVITDHELEGWKKEAADAQRKGMSFDTFFNAYVSRTSVKADKDFLGNAISGTAAEKRKEIIDSITTDEKEREMLYGYLDVGVTAQNNGIISDIMDAAINKDTTAYDTAVQAYLDNNKGADKSDVHKAVSKYQEELQMKFAKLSYDDPAEYERQIAKYRNGKDRVIASKFTERAMATARTKWLNEYTDELARKLAKYSADTENKESAEKVELIYAEAAKYGIKERELNKRADKLK